LDKHNIKSARLVTERKGWSEELKVKPAMGVSRPGGSPEGKDGMHGGNKGKWNEVNLL